ncbi:MAG: DUF456 domain-containing protein [Anaerolineales bacterium]|nr:DUF456 domain-containing protein [Anaerolineales bacterium]MCB9145076.1 DUF456 domain-containing protein [Anaerolineales bacterium]
MDVESLELFLTTFFEVITLFVLIFGLIGLLIPVFPGLVVMWVAILVYAIVQTGLGNMTWVSWLLFALITLLMIGGNISDNIIIAKHVRDKNVPWSSILWSFAAGILVSLFFTPILGILASPLALYLAEWRRLQDKTLALANTKAWMTGWGWSVAARMGVGMVMIIFWGLWAWVVT